VGLTLATAFATAGLRVSGVERSESVVESIASGCSPFHEEGLDEAVRAMVESGALRAFGVDEPLPRAAAYILTVGTPVREGAVSLLDLESALAAVAAGMPDNSLVVLRSTVRVGTTRGIAAALLGGSGKPFRLAMAPERTIEGRALQELGSLPQIVGGLDDASTAVAGALFARLGVEIVPVHSLEAAELAKLASNTYRDLKFAFANELAYLSDAMGVDVYDVVRACNFGYERMNVALPGPVAGPCLEKDAYILADSARQHGVDAPLSMTGRKTNEALVEHVLTWLASALVAPSRVSILGLAFKGRPATSDVRGSMAQSFATAFRARWSDVDVVGWDPLVSAQDSASMGVELVAAEKAVAGADLLLVQTNHPHFSGAEFAETIVAHAQPGAIVVDLWNQLPHLAASRPDLRTFTLGRAGVT
jgi:nucleotide sugar dehydrogenase